MVNGLHLSGINLVPINGSNWSGTFLSAFNNLIVGVGYMIKQLINVKALSTVSGLAIGTSMTSGTPKCLAAVCMTLLKLRPTS
mmetsp:Transcript_44883/g.93524  ORF Transcript_44883/g.93524 Transcript_44883/m.93524 type:complete len:83 (+) Transcript_44883:11-259(+)